MSSVVFRADASLQIGTGHIMRCLTIADALRQQGVECSFICRPLKGNLIEFIRERAYHVEVLEPGREQADAFPEHAHWLEASQREDAEACQAIIMRHQPAWLVVDHYGLEARWEQSVLNVSPNTRLLVLDDLADRSHVATILLDQNLGRALEDYTGLLPESCECLAGPKYAVLRPEFYEWRAKSLKRRQAPHTNNILVTMGGVDKDNAAEDVLNALAECSLNKDTVISVVMGAHAPWLEQVRLRAQAMPYQTHVVTNVSNMAERMARADIAIGAAGSTTWERCCLGLPSIMLILADNQYQVAKPLAQVGAAFLLGTPDKLVDLPALWPQLTSEPSLKIMSQKAASLTDGQGVHYLTTQLTCG